MINKQIGFMYTGQGSEFVGMGIDFYHAYSKFKDRIDEASKLLGLDIYQALQDESFDIHNTKYSQVFIFAFEVGVTDVLKEKGISSNVTMGLSLGEYTAMYDAGVFDYKTGVELLIQRGELMAKASNDFDSAMCAVIGMDAEDIERLINKVPDVSIANYNSPKQIVISGLKSQVEKASEVLTSNGAKRAIMLSTSGAFHTKFMASAQKGFESFIEDYIFNGPTKDLFVNTTGTLLNINPKKELVKQITSSVYFYQMVNNAKESVDLFIEIGPKKTLASFVKKMDRSIKTECITNVNTLEEVIERLEA
jgi:[acyl-carrier-protein] S-malonyltransferase